jgi:PHP family Zn ribbon phosphoesterase
MVMSPTETAKVNGICPRCGKPLVVGVDNRVNFLADPQRSETYKPKEHKSVEYIIPLAEIIAELKGIKSTLSKAVQAEYPKVIAALGNEFTILRTIPIEKIKSAGFPQIAYAVKQLRAGEVFVQPGYDGVYGIIKIFANGSKVQDQLGQLQIL